MVYKYADCSFCMGKVEEKTVTVDYRWKENLLIIEGVPTGVCQQCGEQYFRGEVAEEMERLAEKRNKATKKINVPIANFK